MNILVIGCGKLGSRLSNVLFRHGHSVSVVDINPDAFNRLDHDFDGLTLVGMPMDMNILRSAGVEGCEAAAVVTSDDNLNITVSQIVKEFFEVPTVVARITDPAREKAFYDFGLKTICQTKLTCSSIFSAITQTINEQQLHFGEHTVGVNLREVEAIFVGRNLKDIPLRPGECLVGILRDSGKIELYDGRQTIIINPKDNIIYARLN